MTTNPDEEKKRKENEERKKMVISILNLYAKSGGATLKQINKDYKEMTGENLAEKQAKAVEFMQSIEEVVYDENKQLYKSFSAKSQHVKKFVIEQHLKFSTNYLGNRNFFNRSVVTRPSISYENDYADVTFPNSEKPAAKIQRRRKTLGPFFNRSGSPSPAIKRPRSSTPEKDMRHALKRNRSRSRSPKNQRDARSNTRRSPVRFPYRSRNISPSSSYRSNRSPIRDRHSPKRSASPSRRHSPSPPRRRSPSPSRRRSPSPPRRRSPSPPRRRSPSPSRRRSPSPPRRRPPSPYRRRSPTPSRRRSPSPPRRHSPSTSRRRSPSPSQRHSRSTERPSPKRCKRSKSPSNPSSRIPSHIKNSNISINGQSSSSGTNMTVKTSNQNGLSTEPKLKKFKFMVVGDGCMYYMLYDLQPDVKSNLALCNHNLLISDAIKLVREQKEVLMQKKRKVIISIGASDLRSNRKFSEMRRDITALFLMCDEFKLKPLLTTTVCFDTIELKKKADLFNKFLFECFENVVDMREVMRTGLSNVMMAVNKKYQLKADRNILALGQQQQLVLKVPKK